MHAIVTVRVPFTHSSVRALLYFAYSGQSAGWTIGRPSLSLLEVVVGTPRRLVSVRLNQEEFYTQNRKK